MQGQQLLLLQRWRWSGFAAPGSAAPALSTAVPPALASVAAAVASLVVVAAAAAVTEVGGAAVLPAAAAAAAVVVAPAVVLSSPQHLPGTVPQRAHCPISFAASVSLHRPLPPLQLVVVLPLLLLGQTAALLRWKQQEQQQQQQQPQQSEPQPEQQQEAVQPQQEQQQQQQQLMLCSGPLAPPPPELSSRKGSSQQVLEHQHHQGSALDACPPVLTPMPPSAASHAHPRHLQPSLSVGGLVTVEQLHPQPTADHRVPPHPRATPSARSSSTIIAADVAQPLPLQQPLQPSQCLAAPWQQQQRSGSGSPTPQPGPLPTVRPRTSFDFAVWFGAADCHSSGSISPHGDCVGSGAASGYARSATAPLMLVGSLSKPRPQPSPAGHTFMHMFDEPIAACAAIQEQQQQQQAPLSHTLLHTQPVVRMPRCKVQQLQQRHPQASPVHHPWTDHTLKDPGATQEAPGGAGLHPLPPLAAEPGVETARACAEAGRGDAQEILPATASISTLPSSCGLASIGFHCNDDIADTHVGAGHGDVVHDVNVAHPRMEPLSLHFEQQPHPFAQQQHQQEHHRHLQQQQQQQQGQQPPHFGGHSLQHELHSSSNVPVDPSLFLLQENEEGGQLRDCSLPSMPASAAQFAARLSDLRTASPPSILMDRFHSSSFPGHTPSLQGLADLPRHHQEQQQEQQQRQQGDPEQLDDLLEALDGFQEPPGLSDFNSAPLPRLPSLDHDMDSVFESVVRSGLW